MVKFIQGNRGTSFITRVKFIAFICGSLFFVFFFQLFNLSVLDNSIYETASERNRIITIPLFSTRGLIRDNEGDVIAENVVAQKLIIVPDKTKELNKTLNEIREVLNISEDQIFSFKTSLSKKSYKYEPITLIRELSLEQIAKYSLNKTRWPSVSIEVNLIREVLDGPLYSHVIGYLGKVDIKNIIRAKDYKYNLNALIGKAGIEKFYEQTLRGSVGYKRVEVDVHGAFVRELDTVQPVQAQDLTLAIDRRLQNLAHENMKGKTGAVIAMDPKTGLIKALVSLPDYDPVIFNRGKQDLLQQTIISKKSPLFNRAIAGEYPPASTIKPFLGLLGLNKNKIDWLTEIEDTGKFQVNEGGRVFSGWKEDGHGMVTLFKAIVESSDVFFYNLALKLRIKEISTFFRSIGFGSKTGIDLDNEQTGIVPDKKWKLGKIGTSWFVGDTVNLGIGQGYLTTTPIQLALATSALANRGDAYRPRLVSKIGNRETKKDIIYSLDALSKDWVKMEEALLSVISSWNGTAHNIFDKEGKSIAGKTGTAQTSSLLEEEEYSVVRKESSRRDHALFIGYGPVPDPKLVVVVIVEYGESGSLIAAPIAKELFDDYLGRNI